MIDNSIGEEDLNFSTCYCGGKAELRRRERKQDSFTKYAYIIRCDKCGRKRVPWDTRPFALEKIKNWWERPLNEYSNSKDLVCPSCKCTKYKIKYVPNSNSTFFVCTKCNKITKANCITSY